MSPASATAPDLKFSPTSAVRNSSRRWMEGPRADGRKTAVSINHHALDKFAAEITESILANRSLEVTEWDADGWHYTGTNYRKGDTDDEYYELMRMERVALYILTLDAINFCFWPLSSATETSDTTMRAKNGLEYEHLAIALRKAAEADDEETVQAGERGRVDDETVIIHSASAYALSPSNLSNLTPTTLHSMLQPHFPPSSLLHDDKDDSDQEDILIQYELPNLEVRCKLLNEIGRSLLQKHDGSALSMIAKANKSADALARIILDSFPGFRDFVDTNGWDGAPTSPSCEWESSKSSPSVIHFYKRAQIAIADIWAALGRGQHRSRPSSSERSTTNHAYHQICQFNDMDKVTTFPDYRVPQILRHVDVLQYNPSLAHFVDDQSELEKGGVDEVSIRAGTVVAVEELVRRVKESIISRAVASGGDSEEQSQSDRQKLIDDVSAVTVDWYLWQRGEKLDRLNLLGPHHRVRTTFLSHCMLYISFL
eukprot:CAMPEP_0181139038 /NCGR_PEP_ID=MMETSP1071-20121207/34574_1 /TAXON_ID=35127 /ORGANISM="Thalassiosira sp., Strain NH16" /LENGTH=483 /DNA_ID=CAMNT_0023225929 /DNA_START=109 /DNA_END=1560 /DNA_ORIENTATION=+